MLSCDRSNHCSVEHCVCKCNINLPVTFISINHFYVNITDMSTSNLFEYVFEYFHVNKTNALFTQRNRSLNFINLFALSETFKGRKWHIYPVNLQPLTRFLTLHRNDLSFVNFTNIYSISYKVRIWQTR